MGDWLGYYDTDSVRETFHNGETHALETFHNGETHALEITCKLPKEGEVIVSKDKARCLYDELAGLL